MMYTRTQDTVCESLVPTENVFATSDNQYSNTIAVAFNQQFS